MENYPEFYAQYVRENAADANVYSNIDPARNWDGETIVEIGEQDVQEITWFISGNCLIDRKILIACRSQTRDAARQYLRLIRRLIDRASELLRDEGEIETWCVEDEGATPDIRGIVAGESFYSYYEIKLTEKKNDEC